MPRLFPVALPCVFLALTSLAAAAVSVTPASVTVNENATQQFSASTASTWTTNCGSISSTGLFKAPLYPKVCTITATATNGSGSATASVNVVSPIVMTPVSATTPQGQTQQFTASAPVTWTAKCGTITSGGLYTASAPVGTYCTIEGIATTSPKYTVYGYDKIGAPTTQTFSMTPLNPTVVEGATQQFSTSSAASFSASCGSITAGGLYTAPLLAGSCTVQATSTSGSGSASTGVNVTSPITITPATASTVQGQTQQFTANMPVTWSASCGSINASGLYTASGAVGSTCKVEAIATGSTAYTAFASDTTIAAAFAITPASPTVFEDATQQFSVGGASATWTTDCGSISSTGLFKAPLHPKVCTVTATSGGQTATTNPNVVSPIVMTPVAATTPQGQTQQFTASAPVTWTAACGSISASGLFTATAAVGTYCTVQGTATTSPKYTVYGYDKVGAAGSTPLTITPANPTMGAGTTQQFTSNLPASFSAACGTISAGGLYTAPATPANCIITAKATNGSGQVAATTASVTTASSLAITPASASLFALNKLQFKANQPVTWSDSCNAIDVASGLFTAPAANKSCTITATTTSAPAQTATANVSVSILNYTTFRGSVDRGGAQTQERVLTPATVNANSFGQAWSVTLDSGIWSQPLYMNGLMVNGALHNVVFETTANDSVYAIDGDTGTVLWQRSLLSPGTTAVAGSSIGSAMNPVGIVGTPVIDADDNAMYVVSFTAEQNNTVFVHRLHEIDITTGAEMPGSPVAISFPGFDDTHQQQRPALLLANGMVYIAFGSFGDRLPYQGWVFAYQTNSLTLVNVFAGNPYTDSTGGGAIWMGAMGPSADSAGNIYVTTGNGYADDIDNFGESVVKLTPNLDVADYFTPYDHASLSAADIDLGSGGAIVIPDQASQAYPHELIVCGKPTPVYVLNRDAMGQINSATDNIVQRLDGQLAQTGSFRDSGKACFTTPAFWNQSAYFGANHDVLKKFTLSASTGLLSTTPVSKGTTTYLWPGAYPAISANGNADGIVWAYESGSGTLRATDASNLSNELFVGTVLANAKWAVPTVVNGHVYIGVQNRIYAFAPK